MCLESAGHRPSLSLDSAVGSRLAVRWELSRSSGYRWACEGIFSIWERSRPTYLSFGLIGTWPSKYRPQSSHLSVRDRVDGGAGFAEALRCPRSSSRKPFAVRRVQLCRNKEGGGLVLTDVGRSDRSPDPIYFACIKPQGAKHDLIARAVDRHIRWHAAIRDDLLDTHGLRWNGSQAPCSRIVQRPITMLTGKGIYLFVINGGGSCGAYQQTIQGAFNSRCLGQRSVDFCKIAPSSISTSKHVQCCQLRLRLCGILG
jgi:hypothetical protein